MAESSGKYLLQRLSSLILQENEASTYLRNQIQKLKSRLMEIESFTGEVAKKKQEDGLDCNWESEFIEVIQKAGGCVDQYVDKISRCHKGLSIGEFCSELERIDGRLATISLGRRLQLNMPPASDSQGKEETGQQSCSTTDHGVNTEGEESLAPFVLNFENLPSDLKSCLRYCSIFPEKVRRRRLVRLFVAEGLIRERPGKVMEDIAEENINELVCQGMLRVEIGVRQKLEVVDPYNIICIVKLQQGECITGYQDSESNFPENSNIDVLQYHGETITTTFNDSPIRSLHVFTNHSRLPHEYWYEGIPDDHWASLRSALYTFNLLRVLDLENLCIKSLPEEIGDLIHLRYLGLKSAVLHEIPESIGNLQNLQTLDLRGQTMPRSLPSGVMNLTQLRHLLLPMNKMNVPSGIGLLTNLQSLTSLSLKPGILEELKSLTQLRKLKLKDVSEEHASELSASVMNMRGLLCLSIHSEYEEDDLLPRLDLSSRPLPFIRKLCLDGRLIDLPDWVCSMENLTCLKLGFSFLPEEAILVLQNIPNLEHLTLWKAFEFKEMNKEFCRVGGFPKLETLVIASMNLLEWTEIEEGALPRLAFLYFHNCPRLMSLPEGLQYVSTLKVLMMLPLHPDLRRRLKQDGGKENYKIKHIPYKQFYR